MSDQESPSSMISEASKQVRPTLLIPLPKHRVPGPEDGDLETRLRTQYGLEKYDPVVRVFDLLFYTSHRLVEVYFDREKRGEVRRSYALCRERGGKAIIRPLNGTSPVIHAVNEEEADSEGLRIDEESADQYLRFFCWAVHGDEGPFFVPASFEELKGIVKGDLDTLAKRGRSRLEDKIKPPQPVEEAEAEKVGYALGKQGIRRKAHVAYGSAIFFAWFAIHPATGMVEMVNDEPLESDVPLKTEKYGQGELFELSREMERKRPATLSQDEVAKRLTRSVLIGVAPRDATDERDPRLIECLESQYGLRFKTGHTTRDGGAGAPVTTLKVWDLPFYHNHNLLGVAIGERGELRRSYALYRNHEGTQPTIHPLRGKSDILHRINNTEGLDLSDFDHARRYLRFFCWATHAKEGPFLIPANGEELERLLSETVEDLRLRKAEIEERIETEGGARLEEELDRVSEWLKNMLLAVELVSPPEEVSGEQAADPTSDDALYLIDTFVLYGQALFESRFALYENGMIEMVEDTPRVAPLPILTERYGDEGLFVIRELERPSVQYWRDERADEETDGPQTALPQEALAAPPSMFSGKRQRLTGDDFIEELSKGAVDNRIVDGPIRLSTRVLRES